MCMTNNTTSTDDGGLTTGFKSLFQINFPLASIYVSVVLVLMLFGALINTLHFVTNNTTSTDDGGLTTGFKSLFQINFPLASIYVSVVLVLILFGAVGNTLIITIMGKEKKINKHARKFILNIAVADLCVSAIANPMCIAGAFLGMSYLNKDVWFCVMIASMCLTACICVFMNLVALTVNRWIYICHNSIYNKIYTDTSTTIMCAMAWILGFAAEFPNFIGWSGHFFDEKSHQCIWDRKSSRSYTLFVAIGLISSPFLLLGYCNVAMFHTIWKGKKNAIGQKSLVWSKTISSARTLFVMYFVFLVCWTPYVVVLVADVDDTFSLETHLFVTLLAHSHSSTAFFVYFFVMKSFRGEILRALTPKKTKVGPLNTSTDSSEGKSLTKPTLPVVTATTAASTGRQVMDSPEQYSQSNI